MSVRRALLLLAVLLAALVAWLSFEVGPWVAYRTHLVKVEAKRQLQSAALVPGRFRIAPGGEIVFYARSADPDGTLHDVFIQRRDGERVEAVIAAVAVLSWLPSRLMALRTSLEKCT